MRRLSRLSEDVDGGEDDDPHYVDEVPVDPGHLDAEVVEFSPTEGEAAELLDAYLIAQRERAEEAARAAGSELTGAQTGARESRDG